MRHRVQGGEQPELLVDPTELLWDAAGEPQWALGSDSLFGRFVHLREVLAQLLRERRRVLRSSGKERLVAPEEVLGDALHAAAVFGVLLHEPSVGLAHTLDLGEGRVALGVGLRRGSALRLEERRGLLVLLRERADALQIGG